MYYKNTKGKGGGGGVSDLIRGWLLGMTGMIFGAFAFYAIYFCEMRGWSLVCALISAAALAGNLALIFTF